MAVRVKILHHSMDPEDLRNGTAEEQECALDTRRGVKHQLKLEYDSEESYK
jgi:hypothetical protein